MWTVYEFMNVQALQNFLRTGNPDTSTGGTPVDPLKVKSIYYDGASGHHVVIINP